ncbi:MAG: FixH family protein [Bacteroidetes bacterium]|nr:FixH family protein [Bacteroidota bacterium]
MKLNWGHGITFTYLTFVTVMILFAVKASQQTYDLVSTDYYKDAVNYQERINARVNALNQAEGLQLKLNYDKNVVEVISTSHEKVEGQVSFYKPDNAKSDFVVPVKLEPNSTIQIPMQGKPRGFWKLRATWNTALGACSNESSIHLR